MASTVFGQARAAVAENFLQQSREKVLVFDGAMGTCIQGYDLSADDFDGNEGCNEILVRTRPEVIREIHARYFEVGVDVVETDSFGATSVVLAEYDIAEEAYALNVQAAKIAKEVARSYTDKPRFVAGSVGPGTKLPSLGHIAYADLKAAYITQMQGLVEGGADVLLIETCQDLLQTKAALSAANTVRQAVGWRVPIMVQVTMEAMGTMLVGMDMASVVTALLPYDIDAIGLNCATGPAEMTGHVWHLSQASPFLISCLPNAGIPENVGGVAQYKLTPGELAEHLRHFVSDLGVNIVGGCCGTTPEHLREVVQKVGGLAPARRKPQPQSGLTSLYSTTPMRIEPPPVIIGERTNANGSKKFRDLLAEDDYDALVAVAKGQLKQGAHLLDVCTAYVGRDEVRDMTETVRRFNSQLDAPLMIDSTETPVLEAALQLIAGKAIVNSINLEDGEERLAQVLPLCREFGAAVVALTIDEHGMAKTAEKKAEIADRIFDLAVHKYGLPPSDLVFDTLTFTLGSGDEDFRRAGVETIEALRLIKQRHPEVGTVLGISNISFGLKPAVRHVLNSVFLHEAMAAGLEMAILNSQHILPLHEISETERDLCRRLIFDDRSASDPLMDLIAYYEENAASSKSAVKENLPSTVEERLKYRIVHGEKDGLAEDLAGALKTYSALEIVNTILLEGMRVVGDLFGRGEMQLPFVLQSAEVMKQAVAYLEPHMEKVEGGTAKGTIVLATVKGDVHDIGKNLVDIILTNNGFSVVNLGIKQPIETILAATQEHRAHAIGMSGLLVKSTAIMRENLAVMRERGIALPVLLGGAALTKRFVEEDCQREYGAPVYYCQDAFSGLYALQAIMGDSVAEKAAPPKPIPVMSEEDVYDTVGEPLDAQKLKAAKTTTATRSRPSRPATVRRDVPIPALPFYGDRIVTGIDLDDLYPFLNTRTLVSGQWQLKRGAKSKEAHEAFLQKDILPMLEAMKAQTKAEGWLVPKVIYGYYPCSAEGDDLVIYRDDGRTEATRFQFPRGGTQNLCISDFFAPVDSHQRDVVALQIVTVGQEATAHAQKLFKADRYSDYFYFHGFSVEMAEALAEYWHQKVRQELGIAAQDDPDMKKLVAKGYQGCRYSFGYPACPDLEDQVPLFQLLTPSRIGVSLSEEFMLEPEQSTSALIAHHPEARYFDVRG